MAARSVSPSNEKPRARQAKSQRSFTRALSSPKVHHGFELLGDQGFARVGPQSRRRKVEQRRIVLLLAPGGDDVTETDVYLQVQPCLTEVASKPHPYSSIPIRLSDPLNPDRCGIERHAVLPTGSGADRVECIAYPGMVHKSRRQEVHVVRRPQLLRSPHPKECRTLQGEFVHLARHGEPVQEALDGVAIQYDVEVEVPVSRQVSQACAYGGGDVSGTPRRHACSA